MILLLALSGAMAQQTEVNNAHQLVTDDVPMAVLAAVESDYPGLKISDHKVTPSGFAEIDFKNHIQTITKPDYYAIISGREYRKIATYNKEGELIAATETIKNIAVPRPVYTTIGREYNGWLITKNQATRYMSRTYNNVFYKVWLKNGRKKQQLTMDATGKILEAKRSF